MLLYTKKKTSIFRRPKGSICRKRQNAAIKFAKKRNIERSFAVYAVPQKTSEFSALGSKWKRLKQAALDESCQIAGSPLTNYDARPWLVRASYKNRRKSTYEATGHYLRNHFEPTTAIFAKNATTKKKKQKTNI